ncbi:hypothetical protein L6R53_03685 [Myxococcota bacterium]|nr:hypothetical protein [Myxococcota bacterium]
MSCKSATKTWGPIPVWSSKSTTNWLFHPLSGPLDSTDIDEVRPSFEMPQNSGHAKIRPALRMSNDAQTWDTAVAIGNSTLSADGVSYGAAYEDVSATTSAKAWVQFGIECQNVSGGGPELCMAALKIDHRKV